MNYLGDLAKKTKNMANDYLIQNKSDKDIMIELDNLKK
jgi:hypothetical protein